MPSMMNNQRGGEALTTTATGMLDSTVGKQQEHRRNMPELPAD